MQYKQLGRSGLRVSKIGLGTMVKFDRKNKESAARVIREAVDLGVNFIDTADCYGESEEVVGEILSEAGLRQKIVLATKVGWYMGEGTNDCGTNRAHVIDQFEKSLKKLKTDYVDLYYVHVVDINTPLDETLRALETLVQQGKIRYIGTSKYPVALIMEGLAVSDRLGIERFVAEQCPYSLLDRRPENDLCWMALRHGIGLTPFRPLAQGALTGKYGRDGSAPTGSRMSKFKPGEHRILTPAAFDAIDKLMPLARDKGITLAEMSLAWLMNQPSVASPFVGATTVEYLRSAVKACDVTFTAEELARIDEIVPPGTGVSNFYNLDVHAPLRANYAKTARGGAYIPNNRLEPASE